MRVLFVGLIALLLGAGVVEAWPDRDPHPMVNISYTSPFDSVILNFDDDDYEAVVYAHYDNALAGQKLQVLVWNQNTSAWVNAKTSSGATLYVIPTNGSGTWVFSFLIPKAGTWGTNTANSVPTLCDPVLLTSTGIPIVDNPGNIVLSN